MQSIWTFYHRVIIFTACIIYTEKVKESITKDV